MTKKEFLANVAYLEENNVTVVDEPCWANMPYSRELYYRTPSDGDFSICVDELTSVDLTGRLYDFDVSEETARWWQSGRTPFTDIKDLYEDIDEWKQNFIKIAEGMPY